MKKTIAKINKTKSWFFEKINKIINLQPDSSRKKGMDFPGGTVVKNLPANAGDEALIPGPEISHML